MDPLVVMVFDTVNKRKGKKKKKKKKGGLDSSALIAVSSQYHFRRFGYGGVYQAFLFLRHVASSSFTLTSCLCEIL